MVARLYRYLIANLALVICFAGSALADDLFGLTDEFESASTLGSWQRKDVVEGWMADHLMQ